MKNPGAIAQGVKANHVMAAGLRTLTSRQADFEKGKRCAQVPELAKALLEVKETQLAS